MHPPGKKTHDGLISLSSCILYNLSSPAQFLCGKSAYLILSRHLPSLRNATHLWLFVTALLVSYGYLLKTFALDLTLLHHYYHQNFSAATAYPLHPPVQQQFVFTVANLQNKPAR